MPSITVPIAEEARKRHMSSSTTLPPIPWKYTAGQIAGSFWTWETDHFIGTITTEQRGFYWWLGDLVRAVEGVPLTVTEGRGGDFASAERDLREAVGKAYPQRLGYRMFAGALATTFILADGNRHNLGEFEGERVIVSVLTEPGTPAVSMVGTAHVVHYDLEIESGPGTFHRIRPVRIASVIREAGGKTNGAVHASAWTGTGRIYRGKRGLGCEGTPGYLPDTIEHNGVLCPVHEESGGPGSAMRMPR